MSPQKERRSSKKKRALPDKNGKPEGSMIEETVNIKAHKHCVNCGISIPIESETCSEKCRTEWDRMLSRKKFWNYLPLIGAAFLALLWLLLSLS